ncbi:MAG: DUF4430 domain-containing protein [Clostridia bacterium]|nr:DUF4430 domain-containing protein [Clostridia bacterium]
MKSKCIIRSLLSLFLCFALLAAAVCGIAENAEATEQIPFSAGGTAEAPVPLGEGGTVFLFIAVNEDGSEAWFSISTDEETVGSALLALDLISGDPGAYGLYIKTVCGILADYNVNGHYWGLYVNGDMAMTGADGIKPEAGAQYMLKFE